MGEGEESSTETEAHHVGISPQKDRGGTKGTVGEATGGEEVGGVSDLRAEHSSLAQIPFQKLQLPIPRLFRCHRIALQRRGARRTKGVESGCAVPPHPSRLNLGGNFRHQLHAPSFGFLVEWRQPFAAFLLPNRRGENLPRLLFAFANCVLRG